jgi:hypothetical protein
MPRHKVGNDGIANQEATSKLPARPLIQKLGRKSKSLCELVVPDCSTAGAATPKDELETQLTNRVSHPDKPVSR